MQKSSFVTFLKTDPKLKLPSLVAFQPKRLHSLRKTTRLIGSFGLLGRPHETFLLLCLSAIEHVGVTICTCSK